MHERLLKFGEEDPRGLSIVPALDAHAFLATNARTVRSPITVASEQGQRVLEGHEDMLAYPIMPEVGSQIVFRNAALGRVSLTDLILPHENVPNTFILDADVSAYFCQLGGSSSILRQHDSFSVVPCDWPDRN